jgi:hypothetical protein
MLEPDGRAGTPSQTTGIVEGLRLAMRGVNEVRVSRAEIARKLVEGFAPYERAGRHIQHAVFGIEFVDRGAAAGRVALAEDLLKVAMKQFVDTVGYNISPSVVAGLDSPENFALVSNPLVRECLY